MNIWVMAFLFIVWLGLIILLKRYRVWVLYYLVAVVGWIYLIIFISGDILDFENILAKSVSLSVHNIASMLGVPTRIFEGAPGVILVLVIAQSIGWTVLQVGVESSGLLEICVMASLLLFYPGWNWMRRLRLVLIGTTAIWIANIIRMMAIVIMLNKFGKEALTLSHTYIGKAIFFLMVVAIFWVLITSSTLRDLRQINNTA